MFDDELSCGKNTASLCLLKSDSISKLYSSNGSWVKSMTQTSVDGVGGVLAPRWDSYLQS